MAIYIYGCGGDGEPYYGYRIYLYNLFKTTYLWSDDVDLDIDVSDFNSPSEMVKYLKYEPIDRWSFVMTREESRELLTQNGAGFGFAYSNLDGNLTVLYVRDGSPADSANLKRGDIVLEIDGDRATEDSIRYSIGVNREVEFKIWRGGYISTIYIEPRDYNFRVTDIKIIDGHIGYFRLDSFNVDALDEIEECFNLLKSRGVDELIVDLRYNGGGSLVMASILMDKLTTGLNGEVQFKLRWNRRYRARDYTYRFEEDSNSLNLNRVIFLTGRNSASASEAVINGLKPYMEVITIGDRTYGKPVGMEGVEDREYVYYLVNFKIENSLGISDYFDGLDVTAGCETEDDLKHPLGDVKEALLSQALYFIKRGECR